MTAEEEEEVLLFTEIGTIYCLYMEIYIPAYHTTRNTTKGPNKSTVHSASSVT